MDQPPPAPPVDRRRFLGTVAAGTLAAGAAAATAAAAPPAAQGDAGALEAAFRAAFAATAEGRPPAARLAFLADQAVMIDHDVPFAMDKPAYADHLAFHAEAWQRYEWVALNLVVAIHGETGIVSCYFNERGKPRGAGFRLRAGYCTAVCTATPAGWRALALHLSPLAGQIIDASPS